MCCFKQSPAPPPPGQDRRLLHARMKTLLLALLLAGAGAAPAAPLQRAAPLVLADSAGRPVGRIAGTVNNGGYELAMVVLDLGSARTAVMVTPRVAVEGPARGLYWAPTLRTQVYYASTDCSGPPVVTAPTFSLAYGMRWSVVDFNGGALVAHVGADVAPSMQPARSYRFWDFYAPSPSGFNATPCSAGADGVMGVPTETTVNLDQAHPAPLSIR